MGLRITAKTKKLFASSSSIAVNAEGCFIISNPSSENTLLNFILSLLTILILKPSGLFFDIT